MRILITALALSACAPTASKEAASVETGPTDQVEELPPGFSAQKVKADLEAAIVKRFGAEALKRAQSAEGYVLSRFYQGLPPPPPTDGAPQLPIAALLILDRNVWHRAETGGAFRPLTTRE